MRIRLSHCASFFLPSRVIHGAARRTLSSARAGGAVGNSVSARPACIRREASISFFKVSIAQRIGSVPANTDQNHINRKTHPFGVQHGSGSCFKGSSLPVGENLLAQCDRTFAVRHAVYWGQLLGYFLEKGFQDSNKRWNSVAGNGRLNR